MSETKCPNESRWTLSTLHPPSSLVQIEQVIIWITHSQKVGDMRLIAISKFNISSSNKTSDTEDHLLRDTAEKGPFQPDSPGIHV